MSAVPKRPLHSLENKTTEAFCGFVSVILIPPATGYRIFMKDTEIETTVQPFVIGIGIESTIMGGIVIVVRSVSGLLTPPPGSDARRKLPSSSSEVGNTSGEDELYNVAGSAGGWLYGGCGG